MDDFLAEDWRAPLGAAGLDGFDALWSLDAEWFEPVNQRRGGWSGVVRLALQGADSRMPALFIKRQENHLRRCLRHPIAGEPTLGVEMRSILLLDRVDVPTLRPVYYAQRRVDGRWRAILITEELAGYRPLDEWIADWRDQGWRRFRRQRRAVMVATAVAVRRLHAQRLVHGALYPKHLFVRFEPDGRADVRLIDLETMRRSDSRMRALRRDLDSLNRRTPCFSRTERLWFLTAYLGVSGPASRVRSHWRYLGRRFLDRGGGVAHDC